MPRNDREGEVRGEHDCRYDRGRDGEYEGDNPLRAVEDATRGDDRHGRKEGEPGRDRVQHEQDRERLEDQICQLRLVRHARDERRIDLVP